jgi:hypothetical protein
MLQELSKMFKEFKQAGIDWLLASGKKAQGINAFSVTLSGAAPHAITFADHSLPDFADTNYTVITDGETASDTSVDESTKTVSGFSLLGGADTEVVHIHCIGRLAGMESE